MCDSLPRLMAIKKTRGEKKFKIIVPSETPSYVKDSIVKLGFIPYFFNDNEYLKILNLYHINYLSISGYAHPIINELVVELKKKIVKVEKQKYYLSRNNTIKRSISNEEELINELKKFGFKIIHTENKTLEEQIQIFSECEILVSPHGAGMTNMLFMPKGSKIIEIGHSNLERQTLCYWHLASQLKHDYSYIPVDSDKNEIFMLDANALKLINEVLSME
jgi:capsular polysaccharide biosynthesis protein